MRQLLWTCAAVLSLGAVGLVLSLPQVRERRAGRAQRCVQCRGHYAAQRRLLAVVAVVLVCGSALGINQALSPTPACGNDRFSPAVHESAHGGETPGPEPPIVWRVVREAATAPISGITHGVVKARGVDLCAVGDLTVGVLPAAGQAQGATVGDIFLRPLQGGVSPERAEALRWHESRHADQWAVLALAGGPLALPVLYGLDELFFPGPLNHFERLAGLAAGGYAKPDDFGPSPQWERVAVVGCALLFLGRRRARWLTRVLTDPRSGVKRAEPDRCPLHSHGWFRSDGPVTGPQRD